MQRAREEFLAGSALTLQQHRGVGGRRPMQLLRHLAQVGILADDPRRAPPCGEFLLEQHVFGGHPALRHRARHDEQEVIGVNRLGQEVCCALLHGGHRVLNARVRGHHDDGKFRVELLRGAKHAEPVAFRQLEIGQHERGTRLA